MARPGEALREARAYYARKNGIRVQMAKCINCDGGIYRYDGEDGWQHDHGGVRCISRTVASPRPGSFFGGDGSGGTGEGERRG